MQLEKITKRRTSRSWIRVDDAEASDAIDAAFAIGCRLHEVDRVNGNLCTPAFTNLNYETFIGAELNMDVPEDEADVGLEVA